MNPYLKVIIVAFCTFVIAMLAGKYVQLSSTEALHLYQQKYQELSNKIDVTKEEKLELDSLFKKLNSAENIKADLINFIVKYSTLFLVLVPLTIIAAKQLKLEDGPMFAASGLIFLAFIISGLMVTGAIIGSLFFIVSATCKKGRATI